MTSMNEPEVVTSLLEQIDKLTEEANRYRTALQDIREVDVSMFDSFDDAMDMKEIAKEALRAAIETKVVYEGQLFVFGETSIEYIPGGDRSFPFKRIKEGE